jgi:hypothetical protein
MGCDIHMIAEKRSRYDDDKEGWAPLLTPLFKNEHYREGESLSDSTCPYSFQPYDDRNYELFSVLANVRNGYQIAPISEPRDYPDNMHQVSKWLLDGYDFVDHSPTWLSLEEVLAYDWSQPSPSYVIGGQLADSCRKFLENMDVLKMYGSNENCDIRLIFGFDS